MSGGIDARQDRHARRIGPFTRASAASGAAPTSRR
jgi:hypothetical protein